MEKLTEIFRIDKECKGSRRYASDNEKFPIRSVYVDRDSADGHDALTLTIELSD